VAFCLDVISVGGDYYLPEEVKLVPGDRYAGTFLVKFQMDDGDVNTVLAKFSSNGLVFRLDIANTDEPPGVVLGRILWNDSFSAGYPESLKVAHHLSVFTKADDQALKAFVTGRFRVRRLSTVMLRSVALGCFRGGA